LGNNKISTFWLKKRGKEGNRKEGSGGRPSGTEGVKGLGKKGCRHTSPRQKNPRGKTPKGVGWGRRVEAIALLDYVWVEMADSAMSRLEYNYSKVGGME